MAKFDRESRNFGTRLEFIREIFTNKFEPIDIMAHCVQYKLSKSYESYWKDLNDSINQLKEENPIKVLKRVDSDIK